MKCYDINMDRKCDSKCPFNFPDKDKKFQRLCARYHTKIRSEGE